MYKGKEMNKMEPDFFIVNVASGQPSHERFNILKQYDFPVLNRESPVSKKMALEYLKKRANMPVSQRFASLNLLVYLSNLIDVDVIFLFLQ